MDWVEMTGKTIEEAVEAALVELRVSEEDADIVVLSEAKPGLFGRVRSEARVRARVRPSRPDDREAGAQQGRRAHRARPLPAPARPTSENGDGYQAQESDQGASGSGSAAVSEQADGGTSTSARERRDSVVSALEIPLADQAEVASSFLQGILDLFGLSGSVKVTEIDESTVEVAVSGGDLALLVGPRGTTLDALQDLARVVVQRRTGARHGRLLVDVAGYRQRRRQALAIFTRERAQEVLQDGLEQVLEPMGAADRKVIHDTANSIEGIQTHSEGEDPRRRVVISPA